MPNDIRKIIDHKTHLLLLLCIGPIFASTLVNVVPVEQKASNTSPNIKKVSNSAINSESVKTTLPVTFHSFKKTNFNHSSSHSYKNMTVRPSIISVGPASMSNKSANNMEAPLSFSLTNTSTVPESVRYYEVLEIPLKASISTLNRYKDVIVKGTFQGPTQTLEVDGFWDGDDMWRLRVAPNEVGKWNYVITSSYPELQTAGSFECIPSNNRGFIRKNQNYPYTFMYDDGTPWMWKGDTCWRGMTHLVPFDDRWRQYIDLRAQQGYNAVQVILVSYINGDSFWRNEGGYVFELTEQGKNYDQLNPGYFQWVDRRIQYAIRKGIIPVLFLTWAQELIKFTPNQFEKYMSYIVARYAAYNIIWVISGEYNEVYDYDGYNADTWKKLGNLLRTKDPYDHLITLHPSGNSSSAEFADQDWFDIIMQQTFQTNDVWSMRYNIYWHRDITQDRIYSKPVVNGEYGYSGYTADKFIRIGAWEIFLSGGYFTAGFKSTFAPDKGGWDLSEYQQQQNELKWLFKFVEQVKWWELSPHDELVNNGYCLAKQGEEYVIYSPKGGSVTINFSVSKLSMAYEWFNPRTGQYTSPKSIILGNSLEFSPPFDGDWILHLARNIKRDKDSPLAPTGLSISVD